MSSHQDRGQPPRTSLRIGLVGPIGCGKSTVAGWLADAGAFVIDADLMARAVLEPGEPGHDAVIAAFGGELLRPDGSLDRAALGARVFADPEALARLEAIVHPAVRPLIIAAIEAAEREPTVRHVVVLEAIRLVDGGYVPLMDEVWFVSCEPPIQRARLAERGLEPTDIDRRIGAQRDLVERAAAAATRIIDTSGSPDDTRATVLDALVHAMAEPAAGTPRHERNRSD